MKKIKEKEGKPWCKWCPDKTVKAVWRTSGMGLSKHACELHKDQLREYENHCRDSDHMSEADYQTWWNL